MVSASEVGGTMAMLKAGGGGGGCEGREGERDGGKESRSKFSWQLKINMLTQQKG